MKNPQEFPPGWNEEDVKEVIAYYDSQTEDEEFAEIQAALIENKKVVRSDLAGLVGHRFQSITRREYDWLMTLDGNVTLAIGCMWRLIHDGRIRLTSHDDGQQFGLPAPIDAADAINRHLANSSVEAIELLDGTLDLKIQLGAGYVFEVIPDSSGYEAWTLSDGKRQFIAVGGGDLAIFE